ncbi:MAG TPA: phosphatase PAP2 family protein [Anaerolineales bacterium]|nr:phosphatase PAP2 family protein [Anaerolineales bacterium]
MNSSRWLELDAAWSQAIRLREDQRWLRRLAAVLAHSGDSWFWGLGLLIVIARGSPDARTIALRTLISIAVLAAAVMSIKLLIRRRRPEGTWGSIYRLTDPHSFPSGHAARAVLLAVLAVGWGPAWLALVLILWAPLVALARVAMGLHYVSDIVGGGLLGLLAGVATLAVAGM